MLREVEHPFELTLASARLGPGSQLLCTSSGGQPFGVVDTDEYVSMCPTRQVPTLKDGGLAVWESHSILRYLASKYRPELHLDDVEGLAVCSPWMDWLLASSFNLGCNHDLVDQIARTPCDQRDYDLAARAHVGYTKRMKLVEDRLAATDAFITGERFTIADIPVGVELSRWSCAMERWAMDAARGEAPPLPVLPELPGLAGLFQRLQARPAFVGGCLLPERQHFDLPAPGAHEKLAVLFGGRSE